MNQFYLKINDLLIIELINEVYFKNQFYPSILYKNFLYV